MKKGSYKATKSISVRALTDVTRKRAWHILGKCGSNLQNVFKMYI